MMLGCQMVNFRKLRHMTCVWAKLIVCAVHAFGFFKCMQAVMSLKSNEVSIRKVLCVNMRLA